MSKHSRRGVLTSGLKQFFVTAADNSGGFPLLYSYTWTDSQGFGTLSSPSPGMDGYTSSVVINKNNTAILAGLSQSPYLKAFRWSYNGGFGTAYSDPTNISTYSKNGVDFSPSGNAIVCSYSSTGAIEAYAWSDATGFGTKYSAISPNPSTDGYYTRFAPTGDAVLLAGPAGLLAYRWSDATGFGALFSTAAISGSTKNALEFSPDGSIVFVATSSSPYIYAIPWNSTTGFGTAYSNPAILPSSYGRRISVSPDGSAVALAHDGTPGLIRNITVYKWNNTTGFGTKYSDPTGATISNFGGAVAFSTTGKSIILGTQNASLTRIFAWSWDNINGFGTKFTNPGTLPNNLIYELKFGVIK